MDRREAVRNMAFLMGGAISMTTMGAILESCNRPADHTTGKQLFSADQQTLVTEIADTIIPTTDTPGAKAAGVGPFITMMLNECYGEKAQKVFVEGLDEVEHTSKSKFGKGFVDLSPDQRTEILKPIADRTAKAKAEDKKKAEAEAGKEIVTSSKGAKKNNKPYFFQIARELTLLGYFTSEIGASKALVYIPVPGRYEGTTDLKPGQKAWAM